MMRAIFRQIFAISRINLLSLPQRFWMSLSAVVSIAFVVFVLLGALALNNGFEETLNSSGSQSVAMILSDGALTEINSNLSREQQNLFEEAPGIAVEDGAPLISREVMVIVDGIKRSTGTQVNLPLRGIDANGLSVREGFEIVEGRMFSPGSNEIVIGRSVLDNFDGFALGEETRLGANVWKVVGIFEAGGTVFDSELWADRATVQSLFNRGDGVNSMRARLAGEESLALIEAYSADDPRLGALVQTEKSYFASQSQGTGDLITQIGKPLAFLMAIGALAGAMNAMYASVASRAGEIATLRTIGFGRIPTFLGTIAEAVSLAMIGGLIAVAAAFLVFNNLSTSTLGPNFTQILFQFRLTGSQIWEGFVWAALLGLLGGLLPAWRATRRPIPELLE